MVGLSVLSGSHTTLVAETIEQLQALDAGLMTPEAAPARTFLAERGFEVRRLRQSRNWSPSGAAIAVISMR